VQYAIIFAGLTILLCSIPASKKHFPFDRKAQLFVKGNYRQLRIQKERLIFVKSLARSRAA